MYRLKENPFKYKSTGLELFFRKQFILNPNTNLQYQMFFASNVYYKLCILKDSLYYPAEHIIINYN